MAMPGLDGPQLIAKIKESSPHTPGNPHFEQSPHLRSRLASRRFPGTEGMYAPADLLERVRLLAGAQARTQANAAAVQRQSARSAPPEAVPEWP
jgi:hypothetical protein